MLRHIAKQVKKQTVDGQVIPVDDSNSDWESSDSSPSESLASNQSDDDDDDHEETCQQSRVSLLPQSLLRVLDEPIGYLNNNKLGTSRKAFHQDSSEPEEDDNLSSNSVTQQDKSAIKVCIICPGKQLRTDNLATEHLKSKAHLRRLDRYRHFIHHPPPHTLLSPDPSDIIELLDTLIGPPPVLPPGTRPTTVKGKRKKREKRREKRLRKTGSNQGKPPTEKIKDPHSEGRNKVKSSNPTGSNEAVAEVEDQARFNKGKKKRSREKRPIANDRNEDEGQRLPKKVKTSDFAAKKDEYSAQHRTGQVSIEMKNKDHSNTLKKKRSRREN